MTERQEVAAKLREAGEAAEEVGTYPASALNDITNIIGTNDIRCYKDFFNRLADLIDPTCHDFGGEEGTSGEGYDFACSACGWCGDVTEPNYCPYCGARVVVSKDE